MTGLTPDPARDSSHRHLSEDGANCRRDDLNAGQAYHFLEKYI